MSETIDVVDGKIQITTVKPQEVIPEEVTVKVVSIEELKNQIKVIEDDITKLEGYRHTPLVELEKIDNEIALKRAEIVRLQTIIDEAKKKDPTIEAVPNEEPLEEPLP